MGGATVALSAAGLEVAATVASEAGAAEVVAAATKLASVET